MASVEPVEVRLYLPGLRMGDLLLALVRAAVSADTAIPCPRSPEDASQGRRSVYPAIYLQTGKLLVPEDPRPVVRSYGRSLPGCRPSAETPAGSRPGSCHAVASGPGHSRFLRLRQSPFAGVASLDAASRLDRLPSDIAAEQAGVEMRRACRRPACPDQHLRAREWLLFPPAETGCSRILARFPC